MFIECGREQIVAAHTTSDGGLRIIAMSFNKENALRLGKFIADNVKA